MTALSWLFGIVALALVAAFSLTIEGLVRVGR